MTKPMKNLDDVQMPRKSGTEKEVYEPSDTFGEGRSPTRQMYVPRYQPHQAIHFGSFEVPQFGSFVPPRTHDADVPLRTTPLSDSLPTGYSQERTERQVVPTSLLQRKKVKKTKTPVTSTTEVDEVAPHASKATKKSKLSGLRAEKAALQSEVDQLKDTLGNRDEALEAVKAQLTVTQAQVGHANERIRTDHALIETLRNEKMELQGTVKGMQMFAEMQGEEQSAAIDISRHLPYFSPAESPLPHGRLTLPDSEDGNSSESNASPPHEEVISPSRSTLKIPVPKAWGGGKEEESVNVFVPRLARYLQAHKVPVEEMPYQVLDFLSGKAFQLWKLESETLEAAGTPLTWNLFASCIKRGFGVLDPERHARQQFDSLKQTHTTFSYVNETKRLWGLMKPAPMLAPSEGDVIAKFLTGAKSELRDYLTANTPAGYWTSAEQLFEKAVNWALNNKSKDGKQTPHATSADKLPTGTNAALDGQQNHESKSTKTKRRRGRAARGGKFDAGFGNGQPANKKAKTVPEVPRWNKMQKDRLFAGKCPYCNKDHVYSACTDKDAGKAAGKDNERF